MRKSVLILCSMFIFVACGGGSGAPKSTSVTLGVVWPEALVALDTNSFRLYGSMINEDVVIISDVLPNIKDDEFVFDFGDIPDGSYLFRVDFKYQYMGSELIVAKAEGLVELKGGGGYLELLMDSFTSIGGDDLDGDFVSNLDEVILGLDPFLSDTDGDEKLDGEDLFPNNSVEWSDIDGDGIGDNEDSDIDGDGIPNDQELKNGTLPGSSDSDNDGFSDLEDNCPLIINDDQKDVDGDGRGDACDSDTDGDGLPDDEEMKYGTNPFMSDSDSDGLSDKIEVDFGLDPLNVDSDSDGYTDNVDYFPLDSQEWADKDGDGVGDNGDNCPDIANANQLNTDAELSYQFNVDADALGDVCDDDVDGDGRSYVYVDTKNGSDENAGTFNAPVSTIQKGILLAHLRNEDVVVASGSYNVSDLIFKNGINIRGGYNGLKFDDLNTNLEGHRDVRSVSSEYLTTLYSDKHPTTIALNETHGSIVVDGFHILNTLKNRNSSTIKLTNASAGIVLKDNTIYSGEKSEHTVGVSIFGGSPRIEGNYIARVGSESGVENKGVYIENATPTVINNIIRAGKAKHAIGVEIKGLTPIISNNTIDGTSRSDEASTSTGLIFTSSDPLVLNNVIVADSLNDSDAIAMKCFGRPPSEGVSEFRNNLLSTFDSGGSNALFVNCDGKFQYDVNTPIGDALVKDNQKYNDPFPTLLGLDYKPVCSCLVDFGIDTDEENYGTVESDFFGLERFSGQYDIGAIEK